MIGALEKELVGTGYDIGGGPPKEDVGPYVDVTGPPKDDVGPYVDVTGASGGGIGGPPPPCVITVVVTGPPVLGGGKYPPGAPKELVGPYMQRCRSTTTRSLDK
mmetsp:Transcript_64316/g.119547  ORF Transcript_64316/g.119547 Transcript_64316/m.119547 type:complete len:104 (+) Transcript_64316:646-957(+)